MYFHTFKTGLPTMEQTKALQQSIILQAMFDPTSLLSGPTWLRILTSVARVPGLSSNGTNPKLLEQFIKNKYITGIDISQITCNKVVFDNLIILQNKSKHDKVRDNCVQLEQIRHAENEATSFLP